MEKKKLAEALLQKAKDLGADLAGFAAVEDLKNGPSEQLFPHMKDHARDHFAQRVTTGLPHGTVKWEEEERTLLVFAVSHPAEQPELDWWQGESNPPGNKLLARISGQLKAYVEMTWPGVQVFLKPYHVEKGGVYLKDAAVLAGLGCIGKNNLLINPRYGPRIRLRAIGLSAALLSAGALAFDPCRGCDMPCRRACPRGAFDEVTYTADETVLAHLPAQDGTYYRKACAAEMDRNENEAVDDVIRYCRACEFACRAGK